MLGAVTSMPSFPPHAPRSRRLRPVLAAGAGLLALSLAVAACGGKSSPKTSDDRPTSAPTQGAKTLAKVWPLTGLPAPTTTPKHPVMVVKIDNSISSKPQVGLSKADLVTQELVEGDITRIAAFYYSKIPALVGPVRSMRASDISIVKPAHAVIVTSGGAPPTVRRMARAKITWYGEGSTGFFRNTNGQHDYLHSLFVHLPELAKTLKKKAVVPPSYLPWGTEKDFTGTTKATRIAVNFGGGNVTRWRYLPAKGVYDNTNSYAAPGDKFMPNSVLVIRVKEDDAGYLDPAGHFVPEAHYRGTGPALLFHDGKVVKGTWSKKSAGATVKLHTAAGAVMKVPAGHVWIELQPQNNAGHGLGGTISWS